MLLSKEQKKLTAGKLNSKEAYDKIPENKEYIVVPNATHIEMYYKPEYVNQAVEKLSEFYGKNLKGNK